MVSKNYQFQIRKCNQTVLDQKYGNSPKTMKKCENDKSIETYIEDIVLDAWNVQESIDFSKYDGERPVYKIMDKFGSWLLNYSVHTWENQYL